jgi:purine-binding chemotaxis protein CheW
MSQGGAGKWISVQLRDGESVTNHGQAGDEAIRLVVFNIDGQRYALHLSAVERAIRAVLVTPLPNAPAIVLGVVNVEGDVIPVMNLRHRLGLPGREMRLDDVLILAYAPKRLVALLADAVEGILEPQARKIQTVTSIIPEVPYLEGVAKMEDGLVLIHDLGAFLSLDEERALEAAMSQRKATG